MRTEQKIILSLYYNDPKVRQSNINEAKFSVGMDISQLLFLMEGVFHKVEYKYCIVNGKIQSRPAEDKSKEYQDMVEQETPELEQAGVLAVKCDGKDGFQDTDYERINLYCDKIPYVREYLYFLNILIRNINGTRLLNERENPVFYRLFSNRNGKEFISCLLSMMVKFISAFLTGKTEEADEVLLTLNKDYELMQAVYQEGQNFLENMQSQEQRMRQDNAGNFFVNQSEIFKTWVIDHQNVIEGEDMLEFVFYKSKALKNYALHLLLHIVKITQVLMKDRKRDILWRKSFNLNDTPQMLDFYHLDCLVEELEKEGEKESFDIIAWANRYNARLYEFSRELELL